LKSRSRLLSKKGTVDQSRKNIMNLEQRSKVFSLIQNLEGLLAYAVKTGDKAEEDRIRRELVALVEELE
jgi:hypothetical protein